MYKELNEDLELLKDYYYKTYPFYMDNIEEIFKMNMLYSNTIGNIYKSEKELNNITNEEFEKNLIDALYSISEYVYDRYDYLKSNGRIVYDNIPYYRLDEHDYDPYISLRNINNYQVIIEFVHEIMHDTKIKTNTYKDLSEAVSIYFETYVTEFLIRDNNIDKEKLDTLHRFRTLDEIIEDWYMLVPLLMKKQLKIINENTIEEFHRKTNIFPSKDYYLHACSDLLTSFDIDYLFRNNKYIFGTFLAFYARKKLGKEKMLNLSCDIQSNKRTSDILNYYNIRLGNEFNQTAVSEMQDYILKYKPNY